VQAGASAELRVQHADGAEQRSAASAGERAVLCAEQQRQQREPGESGVEQQRDVWLCAPDAE